MHHVLFSSSLLFFSHRVIWDGAVWGAGGIRARFNINVVLRERTDELRGGEKYIWIYKLAVWLDTVGSK